MHPDGTWSASDLPDLSGRRALLTGATSGLGSAVVEALVRAGAHVVAAGRDERKLSTCLQRLQAAVPGARVRPLLVDLADQASVRRAADEAASHGPLHLLVNNAGVMATPHTRTVDGFELQLATNVLGHFALTGRLWPQLVAGGAEGGAARVVSVSSQAHRMARRAPLDDPRSTGGRYQRWQVYAQTKLAALLFTVELDRRARSAGAPVTALAAHPGMAATSLGSSAAGGRAGGAILDAAFALLGQPPSQGALPLLMAATADLPGGTYVGPGGPGEVRGAPRVVTSSTLARDPETARRLWEVAEDATGVRFP